MKILDRYISMTVLGGVLITLLIFVALVSFITLLGQLADLDSKYGLLQALQYVVLTMPRRAYELFPTIVLIGGLFALGTLAGHHELIVIRAAGVSINRITWAVMKAGAVLTVFAFGLGEVVAPYAEQRAQILRSSAKEGHIPLKSKFGFWVRDKNNFIRIGRVIDQYNLQDILVNSFDKNQKLVWVVEAKLARYRDGKWILYQVVQSTIGNERVTINPPQSVGGKINTTPSEVWERLIEPALLSVVAVAPEVLSAWALRQFSEHMVDNHLDATRYELAFWIKLVTPVSTLVMLLIAIPFVFNTVRTTPMGQRLLFGVLVGIGFFLLNRGLNQVGLVYGIPPLLSAAFPSVLFALVAWWALRRCY